MRTVRAFVLAMALSGWVTETRAVTIDLQEYAFNVDSTIYDALRDSTGFVETGTLPGSVDLSGLSTTTGLGSISVTIGGVGSHGIYAFFDHEIDEVINTSFNEIGSVHGSPAAGQSWEIDEPGYVNGDIYGNFKNRALDNGIGLSILGPTSFPEDVSMALGWDFSLRTDEEAVIALTLSETAPSSGFYLEQNDPDSKASIYFSSILSVRSASVPETGPGLAGLSAVLVGVLGCHRRWSRQTAP